MSELIPSNWTPLERSMAETVLSVADVPVEIRDTWSPERCPQEFLPWLGWALHVDGWDPDWPDDRKRAMIAQSVDIHRQKGTRGAVRRMVEVFAANAIVQEWWEMDPPGIPHTFRIFISESSISGAAQDRLVEALYQVKPARERMEVVLSHTGAATVQFAATAQTSTINRIAFHATYNPPTMFLSTENGTPIVTNSGKQITVL